MREYGFDVKSTIILRKYGFDTTWAIFMRLFGFGSNCIIILRKYVFQCQVQNNSEKFFGTKCILILRKNFIGAKCTLIWESTFLVSVAQSFLESTSWRPFISTRQSKYTCYHICLYPLDCLNIARYNICLSFVYPLAMQMYWSKWRKMILYILLFTWRTT